jgi:hypothetical protein
MREISTDKLIKEAARVLENPFWIPTLATNTCYQRTHDDHDGTWSGKLNVMVDQMGDIWMTVDKPTTFGFSLRFRTYGGGGRSPRTRNALMLLAEAIRLDNLEKPEREAPNAGAQQRGQDHRTGETL